MAEWPRDEKKKKEEVRDSKDDVGLTLTEIAKIGCTVILTEELSKSTETTSLQFGKCFDRL